MKFITFFDCENSFHQHNGKNDPSPYNPDNRLVSIGYDVCKIKDTGELETTIKDYVFFYHQDKEYDQSAAFTKVQSVLDQTQLLVAHNTKHDLSWILESGLKYNNDVYCTMVGEYVLQRGIKKPLSLEELLKEKGLPQKKSDLIQKLLDKGENFDTIDPDIIQEYGEADVLGVKNLFLYQVKDYQKNENKCLIKTRDMMNEYLRVLTDMERDGVLVDKEVLYQLRKEYGNEQEALLKKFHSVCQKVMGDKKINPASPEQLSWVIYSRKVLDKVAWARTFNIGTEVINGVRKPKRKARITERDLVSSIRLQSTPIYSVVAGRCGVCGGTGRQSKTRKDGTPFSRQGKCANCNGDTIVYTPTNIIAGFKYNPKGVDWVSEGGFATDRETLDFIYHDTKNESLKEFVQIIQRLNVLSTWLETFVEGILNACYGEVLHTSFMQCVTATGRLSSRNPNLTNQPRGKTFPVRRAFVSRWKSIGGQLYESDAKGLEYRAAVDLADDPVGKSDIANAVDAHLFTAKHVFPTLDSSEARQDSKPHTFAPLYGATPDNKPENIANYYRAFMEKHRGIAKLHEVWANIVLVTKRIRLPTGREYAFPWAKRLWNGAVSQSTKWKNYPVQGFATADIVPVAGIAVWKELKRTTARSKLVLTVHDNFVVDVHPEELSWIPNLVHKTLQSTRQLIKDRYGYWIKVPIDWESKIGDNLLQMKEFKCVE